MWRVRSDGEIYVSMNVQKDMEFPSFRDLDFDCSCLRKSLSMESNRRKVTLISAGQEVMESIHPTWHYEDYIRPHESGSHTDCSGISREMWYTRFCPHL